MKKTPTRWVGLAATAAALCLSLPAGAAQARGDADSTAAAAPAATKASHAHEDVITEVRNADGSVTQTVVTPAPGVDAKALAATLTKQSGTTYRVAAEESLAQVAACSYGSARTWPSSTTCFVRWSKQGHTRPQVHFKDSSSSAWPVGRAVNRWNQVSGIDSVWRTTACPKGVHCVPVRSGAYGKTGWTGKTTRTLNAAGTYATSASVQLNSSYSGTEAQRWNTVCHETGHVLGLGHNTSTGSCLYSSRTSQRYPTMQDEILIERYY